ISFDTAFAAGFTTLSCCYIAFQGKNSPFRYARPRSNRGRAHLFSEALADLDLYLPGFGFLALWHVNHQHAVLELSFYPVALGQIRKSETANETAIGAFHSMVFLLRLLLLELAFASDRKDSVLDCHFYVFLFHVRQLGFNHVFLVIFGNVGERFPISNGDILSSVRG